MKIDIDWVGGNCPVQAEGRIDGEPFYFRARGEHWSMSVGSDSEDGSSLAVHGRDVIGNPSWYHEEEWGDGPFEAGWMDEDEARRMIERAAGLWRSTTNSRNG